MKATLLYALLAVASPAYAHMALSDPPPLRSANNPNNGGDIDFDITSPLSSGNFPCGGSLSLLGTSKGAPVATYKAGQSYQATITGGAPHNGGSCQFSLSYDKGETWTVIESIVGGCPLSSGQTFPFTIPSDAPSGDEVVFSWSWLNKVGNREFYQTCAVVTIEGGSSASRTRRETVPFNSRPAMFVANINGQCTTPEGVDPAFPNPGPDVIVNSPDATVPAGCGAATQPDVGTGTGNGSGNNNGNDGGANTQPASSVAPVVPPTSAIAPPAVTSSPPKTASLSVSPSPSLIQVTTSSQSSSPGGVFVTQPTTAPEPTQAPTTLLTVTKQPETSADAPATVTPGDGGNDSGNGNNTAQSGPCATEGQWNCIGGTQFQRCAAGQWTAPIAMAAGTYCQLTDSDNLTIARLGARFRRSGKLAARDAEVVV